MKLVNNEALIARAIRAHNIATTREGGMPTQPSDASSSVQEINGTTYVVLRNLQGVLCVYKVKSDGRLARLAELPESLTE
jgi:hypothetical protein